MTTVITARLGALEADTVLVWTDGACLPNPGAGGWGYLTRHPCGAVTEACGGEFKTTNNRMELTAVLEALRALPAGVKVIVHSDSTYVVYGLQCWRKAWARRGWVRKNGNAVPNADLWSALHQLISAMDTTFVWVRGHSGDVGNQRADVLAVAGRMAALRDALA
jgi:ribonuclease HI